MTDTATTNGFPPDKAEAGATSARKLAIALRAAALGVWEWDLVTDEFSYSDRAKEIFGFQAHEDVTRERIIATMHPDDHVVARDQALHSLDPSLTKRQPYRYRIFRADTGEMRWIHAFGEPVRIETATIRSSLSPAVCRCIAVAAK
jgi:PAS domain-containing protein